MVNSFMIFALISTISILGCATAAQNQAANISQNQKLVLERSDACYQGIQNKADYKEVVGRLGSSLAQISDAGFASDQEISSIVKFHNEIAICRQQLITDQMSVNPGAIPILTNSWQEFDSALADLITHKITFGEANKRATAIFANQKTKLVAQFDQLLRDLSTAHYAEIQQRQAAFLALAQWSQQQQMLMQNQQLINSLNRPVMTNCYRVGNSVQCTSY